jgi:hypothetical protein
LKSPLPNWGVVGFLIAETHWTLDYIGQLPISQLRWVISELRYQKAVRDYEQASLNVALQLTVIHMAGDKRRRNIKDVLGEPPQRKDYVEGEYRYMGAKTITLSNGQAYAMRPLNLNMMAALEEKFGEPFGKLLTSQRMAVIRHLLFLMLHEDNSNLTEERVGQLVTVEIIGSLVEEIAAQVS